MKLEPSFSSAFRRAAALFPMPGIIVETGHNTLKPDSFCTVSFDPPIVALTFAPLTFAGSLPALADQFSIAAIPADPNAAPPVRLECATLDSREVGDHVLLLASVQHVEIRGGMPSVCWRRASFQLRLDYPFLASSQALKDFVRAWHSGALPKESWTHAAHVAVTGYYAFDNSGDIVFQEMKRGIVHFNVRAGGVNGPDSGYHETLTRFWSNMITRSIRDARPQSRLDSAVCAVRLFGEDRDLPTVFYSFDVVRDRRARVEWVPPDQEPLPEWWAA